MSINLTLRDFKDKVGLGTRSNRYKMKLRIPGGGEFNVEVAAGTLPESELPPIPVAFRGRILKVPGDRLYKPWTFTVYDSPKNITNSSRTGWKALHDWSNSINNHTSNITAWDPDIENGGAGVADWEIWHYDLNGENELKHVKLWNCWPSSVGDVVLAAGGMDQLLTYQCTVEYEYFTYE